MPSSHLTPLQQQIYWSAPSAVIERGRRRTSFGVLEQEGARLGIVTSKMLDAVELAFAALPPPIVWDVVITTEDTPLHKPHPAPLLAALERVVGTPAEAVYVGDSPFDLQAARAAGTAAIGVTWGAFGRAALEAEEPLVVVDTPAQLLEALAG
ncbi:MAG: HAD family hydrolase [Actinomycetota bacterium]